ncbi:pyruvate, phosphate dikinase [Paenibacillus sp. J5C_2022]|uniref:pyruvate, phosphate dikinase n=1 Tax=Paenibacillus sp. J5C2022 TaxID=2977129 RepID=UPI0021D045F8|nr:pyruvate, phosphate dikinase [Paenibacillus sp. J5C2022]MCU6710731.1 pyruvate, phosphate dikinase [Paenibacillus sp. J5C2022]
MNQGVQGQAGLKLSSGEQAAIVAGRKVLHFQEGHAGMRELLGGKGANLAEMTTAGLPVPPGFTVTTEACREFFEMGGKLTDERFREIGDAMKALEAKKGQRFGNPHNPLLVSVRSGSVTSMPGMMDTILNLGLNDETVQGLGSLTGQEAFAYDCYRRLIAMFGNVVFGIEGLWFERKLHKLKEECGVEEDRDVSAEQWKLLIGQFKQIVVERAGKPFPQQVGEQLRLAVEAVFASWNNQRAQIYRRIHRIPDEQGTAVNIQSMVFGNMGSDCGTGVVFTRNPSNGEKRLFGEYLHNAQGEDVVAGVRTPLPIGELEKDMPDVFAQLSATADRLERHYRDMQDIEFTVERGKLYILQTRGGKRTAQAAVKIAVDMALEGVITQEDAVLRIEAEHLDQLLHRAIDPEASLDVIATGLPASPGAATGQVVFHADAADEAARSGKKVILVRQETTPEDIHGVLAAEGVLTSRGGMTSHAAVVARGMGKPCVCGCESIRIGDGQFAAGEQVVKEGDWISIDGATGRVIRGHVALKEPEISVELTQLLAWADEVRSLAIYTNADTPQDAAKARELGAEGIGLCRTEHMFFAPERLPVVQSMILAEGITERKEALDQLLPMQQSDFEGLFRAMDGLPVTIRLLDPPLHEFLPELGELLKQQSAQRQEIEALEQAAVPNTRLAGVKSQLLETERLIRKVRLLHEVNPMLGQRGCRLGILYPEIYAMQAEAIFLAVKSCRLERVTVKAEIMIPLVGHVNELKRLRKLVEETAEAVLGDELASVDYRIGTMIEVPRAAITADQIAEHAEFFSFGTNDLTQMTYGYSRDDAEGKFLTAYVEQKLLPANPFQELDREGVGELIQWAVQRGRGVKPQLKTGICGEHGGDKSSIFFCHELGLDYVSCSPYRVPLARIAAAQAAITLRDAKKEEAAGS